MHISFKVFRRLSSSELQWPNIFFLITDLCATKLKKYYKWYDFYTPSQFKRIHFSYYTGKTRHTAEQSVSEHRIQEICLTFSWLLLKRQGDWKFTWQLVFKSSNLTLFQSKDSGACIENNKLNIETVTWSCKP